MPKRCACFALSVVPEPTRLGRPGDAVQCPRRGRNGGPAQAAGFENRSPPTKLSLHMSKFLRVLRIGAPASVVMSALLAACASPPEPTQPRTVSMADGKCVQPPYPAEARSTGAEGTTTLSFDVNAEGRVTRIAIVESSGTSTGHRALDALALETLQKCVFPPAPGFLPASSRVAYAWRLQN